MRFLVSFSIRENDIDGESNLRTMKAIMGKKFSIPVDDGNYVVVGTNGFRKGSLTREKAIGLARRQQAEWDAVRVGIKFEIFYRDGSPVKWSMED